MGWQVNEKRNDMYNLWLPYGKYEDSDIADFEYWCHETAEERLWLGLNKNIWDYFTNELDYCIASDWNFVRGWNSGERTTVGEAEYQLKYNSDKLQNAQREYYEDILLSEVLKSLDCLPLAERSRTLVSALPANEDGQRKLAWQLAKEVAEQNSLVFANAALCIDKPEMKGLPVKRKLESWNNIYSNSGVALDKSMEGNDVIIIDDLYQSGATIWSYAKYLKSLGAMKVMGVVGVKSLRDSDNQ